MSAEPPEFQPLRFWPPRWPAGGLWRHEDFLRLWGAQAVSQIGSRLTRTTMPIIAVTMLGASAGQMGLLTTAAMVPGVIIALFFAGSIDRAHKRPLLIMADLGRAVIIGTVPLAYWLGAVTLTQLFLVMMAAGALTTLFRIADNAYLPSLVPREKLVDGNAKLQATDSVAEIGGPGIAGTLIAIAGPGITMVLDVLSYLWSAFWLKGIKAVETPAPKPAQRPSRWEDIKIGIKHGFGHPVVRPLLIWEFSNAWFDSVFMSLYSFYVLAELKVAPGTYGWIVSAGGIGALIGAAMAPAIPRLFGVGKGLLVAATIGQLAQIAMPAAGLLSASHSLVLLVGALLVQQLVGDAMRVTVGIYNSSLRQTVLPQDVLARTNSMSHVIYGILMPVGALTFAGIAEATSAQTAFWVGTVGGLIGPAFLWLSPLRKLHDMPPHATLATPEQP